MPDSAVLQVLIGLALVFAVFSVAVSRLNETVLGFLNYRGRQLEAELRRLTAENVERDPDLRADPTPAADLALAGGQSQSQGQSQGQSESPTPVATVRDLTAELMDGPLRGLRTGGRSTVPAVATMRPATSWWGRIRRAHLLRLPSYLPSMAFARAVLDLIEPAPRALLSRISPQEMAAVFTSSVSDAQRAAYAAAYQAAYAGLTPASAEALRAALPTDCESGLAIADAMVLLLPAGASDDPSSGGTTPGGPMLSLSAEIARLPASSLKTALIGIAARAGADRDKLLAELAQWYDASMDRLSGWYKRRVGRFLVGYALLLTVAFNVDTISLTRALWQDSAVRTAAVATAESRALSTTNQTGQSAAAGSEGVVDTVRDIGALQIPFGWTRSGTASDPRALPSGVEGWALKVLGWLIAVAALAAGAPFWFDLLGRLVNMRSTGPKPKPADG